MGHPSPTENTPENTEEERTEEQKKYTRELHDAQTNEDTASGGPAKD